MNTVQSEATAMPDKTENAREIFLAQGLLPLHGRLAAICRELGTRERTCRAVFAKTPVVPGRFAGGCLACMARLDQTFEKILSARPMDPRRHQRFRDAVSRWEEADSIGKGR